MFCQAEFLPRARIVGGCSMHNYMIFLRGSPEIYDSWDYDGEYVVSMEYAQVDVV